MPPSRLPPLVAVVEQQRIPTTIPWWMGVAIFGAWLGLLAVMVVIARYRFRTRRPERRAVLVDDGGRTLAERTGPVRELPPASTAGPDTGRSVPG